MSVLSAPVSAAFPDKDAVKQPLLLLSSYDLQVEMSILKVPLEKWANVHLSPQNHYIPIGPAAEQASSSMRPAEAVSWGGTSPL